MSDDIDIYITEQPVIEVLVEDAVPVEIIEIADGPMGPPNDAVVTLPTLIDLGGPYFSTGA